MIAVDASVALQWFIHEDGSDEAAALLTGPHMLIAPELIITEVAIAGWKAVRSGGMTRDQHDHAAARLALAFDALVSPAALSPRAVTISREMDHPVYDGFYLAVAEQREATLVTAHRRLLPRIRGTQWAPLAVNLSP
nr:type II toxin-antitoxin system VapC family toxin [uncultured Rhodopila sp.]